MIDDTYREKKGDKTAGVGRFYDHARGRYIDGNCFVSSCLQVGEAYIPHKAVMYLKREAADAMGEEFRTKPEIALRDMIEPLQVPTGVALYVVFDSWWYSQGLVLNTLSLGHHVVCRLKSNKKIEDGLKVFELAATARYRDVEITVRGKKKAYLASEKAVKIPGLGEVKLVISKRGKENPRFYLCTDLDLGMEEVLGIYENRWSIELAHREANQKFGFKDYMMRGKRGIERYMQLSFLAWTIILVAKATEKDFQAVIREMRLGEILDEARLLYFVEMLVAMQLVFESAGTREELAERLADLLWNGG